MIDLTDKMDRRQEKAADFAIKGWITRVALLFNACGERRFTGSQIAQFLLELWHRYEVSKSMPAELAEPEAKQLTEATHG